MSEELDQNLDSTPDVSASTPAPNMLSQEQVDKIVRAKLAKEREKWESKQVPSEPAYQNTPQIDERYVDKLVAERFNSYQRDAEKKAMEAASKAMANKVLESYNAKMDSGKEKYPDFEQRISDFNPREYPELIHLAEKMNNTADVMYNLAVNEAQALQISLAFQKNPERALKMMGQLSKTISDNETAKANTKHTRSISQIKPSSMAVGSGKPSIQDLRKSDFLKRL